MRLHQLHSCCSHDHRPFCLPKKSTHTLPAACMLRLPRLLRTIPRQPSAMPRSSFPSSRPTASLGSLIHHSRSFSCAACLATTFRLAQVTRVHQDPSHARVRPRMQVSGVHRHPDPLDLSVLCPAGHGSPSSGLPLHRSLFQRYVFIDPSTAPCTHCYTLYHPFECLSFTRTSCSLRTWCLEGVCRHCEGAPCRTGSCFDRQTLQGGWREDTRHAC